MCFVQGEHYLRALRCTSSWAFNDMAPGHFVNVKTKRYCSIITCDVSICSVVITTVYPKKYAHGFCFAVLCCGYTLTDFPISIRLTSLARWQSNDCPSASKATLINMDKYFMWIHYERLHNHNKAKHNKTVCIFLGIYCKMDGILCNPYQFHYSCVITISRDTLGYFRMNNCSRYAKEIKGPLE